MTGGLDEAISIDDLVPLARRRLPRFLFDYIHRGSGDEATLRRNRQVLERWRFRPRTLVNVAKRDQSVALLGAKAASPMIVGPTGLTGLFRPQGELLMAKAAAKAGLPFALSTASLTSIETVAKEAPGRLWFQAYIFRERQVSEALIRRARDAGYEALVITSDFQVPGKREFDWRNGLARPEGLSLASKLDILRHPRWIVDVIRSGGPHFVNVEAEIGPSRDAKAYVANEIDPALCWDDIKRYRDAWPRKLLVKGILRADDAAKAVALGVNGVVLSNHGGRQLDSALSAIDALPEVAREIGEKASLIVDGGIRRGGDVIKARCLGAEAVILGRAPLYGLVAGGESGTSRALAILKDEIDRDLALLGCPDFSHVGPDLLVGTD